MSVGWVVVIMGGIGALCVLGWYYSPRQKILRTLRNTRACSIGDAPFDTTVRITGTVAPGQGTLTAPLTGRVCVYYKITVEEKGDKEWTELFEETMGVSFAIEDGSGRAIVDPSGAKATVKFDGYSRSGTLDDATPQEEAILQRHDTKSKGWVFNKSLRYNEGVIEPGERVVVVAKTMRSPDGSARIFLGGDHANPLFMTDETDQV